MCADHKPDRATNHGGPDTETDPVLVAVGSNLGSRFGDRRETLILAIDRLAGLPDTRLIAVSSIIPYASVGGPPDAPPYLNAAVRLGTTRSPGDLLHDLLRIEREFGRSRTSDRNAPRTLDLDVLMYGDTILNTPPLILPHPRMHLRRFVLEPASEIASETVHPLFHRSIRQLLKELLP